MKKTAIFLLMSVMATLAGLAQPQHSDTLREKLFEAKMKEFSHRLLLTDEQQPRFAAIYKRYDAEMRDTWGKQSKTERADKEAATPEAIKQRMQRQQRAGEIRLRYVDEFSTVLNSKQLERFFEVEKDIQTRLKHRHDNPLGKGKGRMGKLFKKGKRPYKR